VTAIAALYVEPKGVYFNLPGVDPWDIQRDARKYAGPHPVVAHPPCQRWGRYWSGGPSAKVRRKLGDDGGCFAEALYAVRTYGGVLEHPEASHAWRIFNLARPAKSGGWIPADRHGGWTCCVEQGHYGHKARKATWLYCHPGPNPLRRVPLPLIWGPSEADPTMKMDEGYHSKEERQRATRTGACQRLSKRQRAATPPRFRDALLAVAAHQLGALPPELANARETYAAMHGCLRHTKGDHND
jgi:hypothetical protein